MFVHLDISKWNVLNLVKMQESNCVPVAVFEEAQIAVVYLLPAKSREHYEKVFAEFYEWREKRGVMTINEDSCYQKICSCIFVVEVFDVEGYHESTKIRILENIIEEFLARACDKEYLMIKVALIMGISGACRCCELTNWKSTDIKNTGSYLLVSIPDTKTGISRKFTIIEEGFCIHESEMYVSACWNQHIGKGLQLSNDMVDGIAPL
ncbi:hypothetical protein NQ315_014791 [Exocentrus adspersus]|uniref:Uncharacterized protein n=1 Tax=Exocentrus adspersus TaxID=1586481 RepID=A0AAV8VM17_9CUCU|nr:hypothetical protein NQ315_014791 [Exocentrus adspersus]